ncbi:MAG: polysaccharide deacetylase family protein [Acidimicrobiia bacterium]|nr:polysaccharide deacetylase family protein [Acidimicrobiia bacterium]
MTSRIWAAMALATLFVVGAVGASAALGDSDAPLRPARTEVLGRTISVSTSISGPSSSTSSSPSTTTTVVTAATTIITAAAAQPATLTPGPLAMPSPATPVYLTDTTPALDHVPTTDKVIFLGIDDGLVRDPAVLDLLRKERVPLTLFLVREPAVDGKSYFQEMQSLGSTIQAHTVSHPQLKSLGYGDQQKQICGDLTDLQNWYGNRPTLFRPPYGEWNETTRSVVANCGLNAIVLWRGATNDGRLDLVGETFHPGDILLMHFRTDLLQNLKLVFARARAEGYRIGRIEDYLGTGPAHPMFTPAR